jgi:hypothetical protein
VHVGVEDLAQSIQFYSTLSAAEPTVIKNDYAKWMLEDQQRYAYLTFQVAEVVSRQNFAQMLAVGGPTKNDVPLW